jgi:hypothetical protein
MNSFANKVHEKVVDSFSINLDVEQLSKSATTVRLVGFVFSGIWWRSRIVLECDANLIALPDYLLIGIEGCKSLLIGINRCESQSAIAARS